MKKFVKMFIPYGIIRFREKLGKKFKELIFLLRRNNEKDII
jgi:hypothetical protein